MKKETFYIVNTSQPFNGYALATFEAESIESAKPCGLSWQEYNETNGGTLEALKWNEFKEKYYQPYLKDMQKPFKETTEDEWEEMLGCVPPLKWRQLGFWNTFYVGECYTADIYSFYAKNVKTGKCVCGLRSIYATTEELISELNNQ